MHLLRFCSSWQNFGLVGDWVVQAYDKLPGIDCAMGFAAGIWVRVLRYEHSSQNALQLGKMSLDCLLLFDNNPRCKRASIHLTFTDATGHG